MCSNHIVLPMPPTLSVHDLRSYNPNNNLVRALQTPFLILVGGDIARAISANSMNKQAGHKMLYPGSVYSKPVEYRPMCELEQGQIDLTFHSTMAVYERVRMDCHLKDMVPVQSSVFVLPTKIWDRDVPKFQDWVIDMIKKSFKDSIVTLDNDVYNAWTLAQKKACTRTVA
jgi:hypothetical protein